MFLGVCDAASLYDRTLDFLYFADLASSQAQGMRESCQVLTRTKTGDGRGKMVGPRGVETQP
jgi:hypothetical protein